MTPEVNAGRVLSGVCRYRRQTRPRFGPPILAFLGLVSRAYLFDFWKGNRSLMRCVDASRKGRIAVDDMVDETGNVLAGVIENFFKIRKPTAELVQYANLWERLWNEEYMKGYQPMGRSVREPLPLAGAAARQIVDSWIKQKVTIDIADDNQAAIAMFRDLGFEPEALLRDQLRDADGGLHDIVLLAHLVDEQWSGMHTAGLDGTVR